MSHDSEKEIFAFWGGKKLFSAASNVTLITFGKQGDQTIVRHQTARHTLKSPGLELS